LSPLLIVRNLEDPPGGGVFDKMLKEPCPYHKGPTNHNLEDYHMLRRYFESLDVKKDDKKKDPKGDDKDEGFSEIHDCFMIFGGPSTCLSTRQRKRERYPLVVDPIITNTRLTKVLMDGGSSLNFIYAQTLDLLGIARTHL
jgi:hypothetical protein